MRYYLWGLCSQPARLFSVMDFFDSNFFQTLVVGGAGVVTFIVYLRQKRDKRIQAARLLLIEIRTAEERIAQIKDRVEAGSGDSDFPSVFPTKSWKIYSHLFISDFDQDEIKAIASFYDYGEIIEEFAKRNNDFFWVTTEERSRVIQQKLADLVFHTKYPATPPAEESPTPEIHLINLKQSLLDAFANDTYTYTPVKTINEIKKYIVKVEKLTTSSVGIRLKRLAKLRE